MSTMPFSPVPTGADPCSEMSVCMLHTIFGPVIDSLVAGTDPNTVAMSANLLATLFSYFDSGILVVGSLIVSYIAVMGAMNTASDGEALGKAWSTPATTMRIVAGGAVLLPSASGYSFIQTLVLTIALWGIGFANGIYQLGVTFGVFSANGVVATSQAGAYFGMREFAKQYLASSYCARAANAIYTDDTGAPNIPALSSIVSNLSSADKVMTTSVRNDYTFFSKDQNTSTNLGGGDAVCGAVTLTTFGLLGSYTDNSGVQSALDNLRVTLDSQKLAAVTGMMQDIDAWVATMPTDSSQPGWDAIKAKNFNDIVAARENQVTAAITSAMNPGTGPSNVASGLTTFSNSLSQGGWSMAGGWYQRVGLLRTKLTTITGEAVATAAAPSLSSLPSDQRSSLLRSSLSTVTETIIQKAELAGNGYQESTTPKPEDFANAVPKGSFSLMNVATMSDNVGSKLSLWVNGLMQSATNTVIGSTPGVDALTRMKTTGDLLATAQLQLWTAKVTLETAMTAARVVVGGIGGVEVLGNKIDERGVTDPIWEWIEAVPVPIIVKIADYVGYLGFYFSVLLPSLPYTIFMITVVGWVLAVLQSVIAAPLWALMHMRPSQTFVGSDQQGYLLLMALFVRPALAVVGLFASVAVCNPVMDYISAAFFGMRGDVVASTGLLGALAQFMTFFWWFTAFGLLLAPVLYMIFGLPQVLPDQVLQWLGAGVHDLGATGATGKMQSSMLAAGEGVRAETRGAKLLAGGGSGGGGGGGGRSLPGGGSGGRLGSSGGRQATPLSANPQGVAPASADGGSSPAAAGGGGGGGGPRGGSGAPRPLGSRFAQAAGVALGRAATGVVGAVADSLPGEGRQGSAAGRLATGLAGAARTAGAEGAAAWRGGAEGRIRAFAESVTARRAAAAGAAAGAGGAAAAQSVTGGGQGVSSATPAPGPSPQASSGSSTETIQASSIQNSSSSDGRESSSSPAPAPSAQVSAPVPPAAQAPEGPKSPQSDD